TEGDKNGRHERIPKDAQKLTSYWLRNSGNLSRHHEPKQNQRAHKGAKTTEQNLNDPEYRQTCAAIAVRGSRREIGGCIRKRKIWGWRHVHVVAPAQSRPDDCIWQGSQGQYRQLVKGARLAGLPLLNFS